MKSALEEFLQAKRWQSHATQKDPNIVEHLVGASIKLHQAAQIGYWSAMKALKEGGMGFNQEYEIPCLKSSFEAIGLLAYMKEDQMAMDYLGNAISQMTYHQLTNPQRLELLHDALKFIVQQESSPTFNKLVELKK